jgi:hypothetical protein
MLKTFEGGPVIAGDRHRFACMSAGQSSATELLRACPVVTATGQPMGRVRSVMVDLRSRQLRFVVMAPTQGKATVVIPWQALYFDSSLVRLVYYTFS